MKRLMFVLAVLLAAGAASAARVGIMTDTHVGHEGKATSERLERCYRHFKNHQVDMIFHLGDIADYHDPDFYREYVAIRAKVYPTNCPLGAALSSRLCHGATADALK